MEPISRTEIFLAGAAGQANIDLPAPNTREEIFLNDVCERFNNIDKPTAEQVQTAVNNYLDENSIVFNTSAEITEVLHG